MNIIMANNLSQLNKVVFKKPYFILFVISYLIAIGGCATSVTMKQHDRTAKHKAVIDKNVTLPERMYYQGIKESLWGGTLGLVGAAIASEGQKKTEDIIKEAMKKK